MDKLEAVRRTRDQVELSARARRANVAGAIASRQPVASGIHILDDVFTAGAASSARAEASKKAGAKEVRVLTPCRTC